MGRPRPEASKRSVKGHGVGSFSASATQRGPGKVKWEPIDPEFLRRAREAQKRGVRVEDFAESYEGDPIGRIVASEE